MILGLVSCQSSLCLPHEGRMLVAQVRLIAATYVCRIAAEKEPRNVRKLKIVRQSWAFLAVRTTGCDSSISFQVKITNTKSGASKLINRIKPARTQPEINVYMSYEVTSMGKPCAWGKYVDMLVFSCVGARVYVYEELKMSI